MSSLNISEDFHLTCLSNSSLKFYPDNTSSSFVVHLSREILLDNSWSVALKEISYDNTILNVTDKSNIIEFDYKRYNIAGSTSETEVTAQVFTRNVKFSIDEGFYNSLNHLAEVINTKCFTLLNQNIFREEDLLRHGRIQLHKFNLESAINLMMSPSTCIESSLSDIHYPEQEVHLCSVNNLVEKLISLDSTKVDDFIHKLKLKFHGRLATQFGFSESENILKFEESPNYCSINLGISPEIFVYIDIIEPQLISHEKVKIIKIIKTFEKSVSSLSTQNQFASGFGESVSHEILHPNYIPLEKNHFRKVEIELRDRAGALIRFSASSLVMLNLHFKRNFSRS
jgi:hypothetical protein